jgi:hypothetical protein
MRSLLVSRIKRLRGNYFVSHPDFSRSELNNRTNLYLNSLKLTKEDIISLEKSSKRLQKCEDWHRECKKRIDFNYQNNHISIYTKMFCYKNDNIVHIRATLQRSLHIILLN